MIQSQDIGKLSVVIPIFNEEYLNQLNEDQLQELLQQQQAFVELLSFPDPDIYTWIMGFGDCEHQSLAEILAKIRELMKVA